MMTPRQYFGVVVSSTYEDLREHRAALMSAIQGQQLHAVAMESDSARPITVIESSLQKVRDAAAYIAIIGRRYGSITACPENPDGLSLTHLEFREAVRLGRPILVFIMGADHLVTEDGIELDPDKRAKLAAFREEAKFAGGEVHQVYKEFNDLASFAMAATQSIAELCRMLDAPAPEPPAVNEDHIPVAPALYARPRYLGSHEFVGREAQLTTLNDWARPAGQHSVLLFEAIGGSGKSILTWEWTTRHAPAVRGDWAGCFWYSFYEAGAVMADFCRHALAYMTGKPLKTFEVKKQLELTELLLHELESRPWLLVLDGLERVLVAYHRLDAAQVLDEEAGGSDEIAHRDPTTAIRPEDDDLVRHLADAAPSRILITSRLVPRVLLNQSSQPIPGVLHERLPGLRPADAEALMRNCRVRGDSAAMRSFLQRHCDCHPLVTGIVAGLVNDYLLARGDFDRWSTDLNHGGSLEIGELDLVQKRNHILRKAVDTLPRVARKLLSTLALLPGAVDYARLDALNRRRSSEKAVSDLERRGLLQYDLQTGQYDLHPVVRAVVADGLGAWDRRRLGNRVIDYFSARRATRYEAVSSLEELRDDMTLVQTLVRRGRLNAAADVYFGGLDEVLRYQFESVPEMSALLRPFFGAEWSSPSPKLSARTASPLANDAASTLSRHGDFEQARKVWEVAYRLAVKGGDHYEAVVILSNIALALHSVNRLAASWRIRRLNLNVAERVADVRAVHCARSDVFEWLASVGRVEEAEEMWRILLTGGDDDDDRFLRRQKCEAALVHASLQFERGLLTDDELAKVEAAGRRTNYRYMIRSVHLLRGWLCAQGGDWPGSAAALSEAVRMAREVGLHASTSETRLALAQTHLDQLSDPAQVADQLAAHRDPDDQALAELWLVIGDADKARDHALAAYRWAWAEGEPYVRALDLERAKRLLAKLDVPVPVLPPYDPANDPELPVEAVVRAFLKSLRR
ncbi:DUF4062 domain-containing protein [Lentzea sp. BCCO 10_0856]|uniref:DUF4062 domain-containing protein n=1 Tax=Lentzea miocenica TaxID=3095431 RepID=A0ABU4SW15_9PSEU|nr:DUF4062 domain-containing protein [Lentzea sp. BCCO 10_0856]MDX8030082.1 DUF4062 domain-containing protein [Lentzea sp. BCCO 10_0856]